MGNLRLSISSLRLCCCGCVRCIVGGGGGESGCIEREREGRGGEELRTAAGGSRGI